MAALTKTVEPPSKEDIIRVIKRRVESIENKSRIFEKNSVIKFPRIRREELNLDKVLGFGSFSVVNEIISINIDSPLECNLYENEEEDREFIKSHCIRRGDARYAIKQLKKETKEAAAGRYMRGAVDLAVEARFFAVVHHPHIIRMRAVADCSPYEEAFFIVLDRLYSTLADRMKLWKKKHQGSLKSLIFGKPKTKVDPVLIEKLIVAYQIGRAMAHFHQMNIIYRDLKPQNIGFDVRGDVKIFDLGFAKEVHMDEKLPDGTFKLTGKVGSLRYMAPEVVKSEPYTFTSDVYSFAILLWEIISLETSFEGYSEKTHLDSVVNQGQRPKFNKKFPESLKVLISIGWSSDLHKRSDFTSITRSLKQEVSDLNGGESVLMDFSSKTNRSN